MAETQEIAMVIRRSVYKRNLMAVLVVLTACFMVCPAELKAEEISWRYVTLSTSQPVLDNPFTPKSSKGLRMCTTLCRAGGCPGGWSVKNSGYPAAAKGWSVNRINFRETHIAVDRGLCHFAAVRWDQSKSHEKINTYFQDNGLVDIPALNK